LCRVMLQAAPSGSRRERLVKAVGLICIPRAKGRVRLRIFAARADPLDEQTSLLRAQHERLRWEMLLLWLLHVVEEAFGVADVTYTERDVEYELAF
jgi:hypothetical protein